MEISLTLTVLLLQFPSVIYAGDIQIHTLRGGSVELVGEVPKVPVDSIMWNWNKNKVVEWEEGDQEPFYYSIFQNKSKLNMVTWALNISDLQPGFTGQYTLLINDVLTAKSFQLVVLEPVSEPKITEDCSSGICNLTCQGIDSSYTKYTWTNDQGKTETGSVWRVEKSERLDVVYSCNFSNPVSWKTTSVSERDLFPTEATKINLGIILGPIVAAIVITVVGVGVGVGVVRCKKQGQLQGNEGTEMMPVNAQNQNQQNGEEPGAADKEGGESEIMNPPLVNNEGQNQNQQDEQQPGAADKEDGEGEDRNQLLNNEGQNQNQQDEQQPGAADEEDGEGEDRNPLLNNEDVSVREE